MAIPVPKKYISDFDAEKLVLTAKNAGCKYNTKQKV